MNIYHSDFWNGVDFFGSYLFLASCGMVLGLWIGSAGFAAESLDVEIVGGAFFASGLFLLIMEPMVLAHGKAKVRKAVNLYNNGKMYSQNTIDIEYGFRGNGVFLTFRF